MWCSPAPTAGLGRLAVPAPSVKTGTMEGVRLLRAIRRFLQGTWGADQLETDRESLLPVGSVEPDSGWDAGGMGLGWEVIHWGGGGRTAWAEPEQRGTHFGVSQAEEGLRGCGSRERAGEPHVSCWNRAKWAGLQGWNRHPEALRPAGTLSGQPPTLPAQPSPRSCFRILGSPWAPDRAQIRERKINSLCRKTAALSHTAVTIPPLFPMKPMTERPTPIPTTVGVLNSSPPEPGGGVPRGRPGAGGHVPRKTMFPQDGRQLALGSCLKPKYMARCPQVGEVEK